MKSIGKTRDMIATDIVERFGEDVLDTRKVYTIQVGAPEPGGAPAGASIEVQYDPYNRRLKFFDLAPGDARNSMAIASTFENDRPNDLYSKIIVYARAGQDAFEDLGMRKEAAIRGYFRNGDDAELWAKYLDEERSVEQDKETNDKVYEIAQTKQPVEPSLPPGYTSAPATIEHAEEIAALMGDTFDDYPTPITVDAIRRIIKDRASAFRVVRNEMGDVVASASGEMHHTRRSAEMTDCSTRPDQRGKGLMSWILRALEDDLRREFGITDLYTIARAVETGMNCSFAKLGYTYTGRLINNCRMPEGWESMNVWCKSTGKAGT